MLADYLKYNKIGSLFSVNRLRCELIAKIIDSRQSGYSERFTVCKFREGATRCRKKVQVHATSTAALKPSANRIFAQKTSHTMGIDNWETGKSMICKKIQKTTLRIFLSFLPPTQ